MRFVQGLGTTPWTSNKHRLYWRYTGSARVYNQIPKGTFIPWYKAPANKNTCDSKGQAIVAKGGGTKLAPIGRGRAPFHEQVARLAAARALRKILVPQLSEDAPNKLLRVQRPYA